jgi:hypothetical protein
MLPFAPRRVTLLSPRGDFARCVGAKLRLGR